VNENHNKELKNLFKGGASQTIIDLTVLKHNENPFAASRRGLWAKSAYREVVCVVTDKLTHNRQKHAAGNQVRYERVRKSWMRPQVKEAQRRLSAEEAESLPISRRSEPCATCSHRPYAIAPAPFSKEISAGLIGKKSLLTRSGRRSRVLAQATSSSMLPPTTLEWCGTTNGGG